MCQIEWCWLLLCEREVSCSPASGRCTSLHVVFNWIYLPFIFSLKPNFKVIKLTPVSFVWSLPESTLVCHTIYVANRILFAVFNRFVARHRFCFLSCRRLRFGRRLIVFCLLSLAHTSYSGLSLNSACFIKTDDKTIFALPEHVEASASRFSPTFDCRRKRTKHIQSLRQKQQQYGHTGLSDSEPQCHISS